jgi:hypothetical protein
MENIAGLIVFGIYLAWTYATIQQIGASPILVGGALGMGILVLLLLFGQRITRIDTGERTIYMDSRLERQDPDEWQKENR